MNRREMVAGNYMFLQVSRIIALFACTLAFHCSCTAAEVRTEEFTVEVKGRTLAIMCPVNRPILTPKEMNYWCGLP